MMLALPNCKYYSAYSSRSTSFLLGQYVGYPKDVNVNDTRTPTYAIMVLHLNTPRWKGVPFVLEAGKALDEKRCEVRIQLVNTKQVVMRIQPNPAVYVRYVLKKLCFITFTCYTFAFTRVYSSINSPSSTQRVVKTFSNEPDAYTKLLLDVLCGRRQHFVSNDEILKSWQLFTPLLERMDGMRPIPYRPKTTGPTERREFLQDVGIVEEEERRRSAHAITREWDAPVCSLREYFNTAIKSFP